jgi:hypothetical protein
VTTIVTTVTIDKKVRLEAFVWDDDGDSEMMMRMQ